MSKLAPLRQIIDACDQMARDSEARKEEMITALLALDKEKQSMDTLNRRVELAVKIGEARGEAFAYKAVADSLGRGLEKGTRP